MNKYSAALFLLCLAAAGEPFIDKIHGQTAGFEDVHVWPGSKCGICHQSSDPGAESPGLVNPDQSRLCESCHEGTVTISSPNILNSSVKPMNNHPIKFSPLDFDPEKINQTIVREGVYFYVSGGSAKVPLFGDTRESAVSECTTCHDPHGRSGVPKLLRVDNANDVLCLVCHRTGPE